LIGAVYFQLSIVATTALPQPLDLLGGFLKLRQQTLAGEPGTTKQQRQKWQQQQEDQAGQFISQAGHHCLRGNQTDPPTGTGNGFQGYIGRAADQSILFQEDWLPIKAARGN